jgi:hypothetical protein
VTSFLDQGGRLDQRTNVAIGGIAIRDGDWPTLREL